MKELNEIAITILSHIDIYLSHLPDEDYSRPLPLLSDASIGSHTRHIIDGFLCIMNQHSSKLISYDNRDRDKSLECDTKIAYLKLQAIKKFMTDFNFGENCNFEATYSNHKFLTHSSLEREIIHNIEHVIHHLAIIKIALKYYHPEIKLPMEFGVAFSTLSYWNTIGLLKT